MKKLAATALSALMLLTTPAIAFADNSNIQITVNGQALSFDQPPVIENGRTLVPLRAIFEALGANVSWDPNQQIIDATKGNEAIRLQIGWNGAWINQTKESLDTAPEILNGRTLVPVRFVSEALGANVQWNSTTQTVAITTGDGSPSTGTSGDGLANFTSQTGLAIGNWSVQLDKFGEKKNYRVIVTGKITNNNQTTTTLNWSWFMIRKPGQNAQYATLDSLLFNASDFDILPGDSVDMKLSFSIPIGDNPSDYQMFIKGSDGSLIPVSSLAGYQDGTNYSLANGTDIGDYGGQDGFEKAVGDDALTVVDYLLQHGKTGKDVDSNGEPVLKYAIDSDDPDMVNAIVNAGADLNASIDNQLPYDYAYHHSTPAVLLALQQDGATQSGRPDNAYTGAQGLINAVTDNKPDAVQSLLDSGVDPNTDLNGQTALMIAAQNGYDDIVKELLAKGANTEIVSNTTGSSIDLHWTALMIASWYGKTNAAQLLINAKANVNATDLLGDTPLIDAVQADQVDIVKLLLSNGATVDIKDKDGKTALQYAQEKGYTDIINLLGSNSSSGQINSNAQPAPTIYSSIGQGSTSGNTEITVINLVDQLHDHLVYVPVNAPTATPNVGDTAPSGTTYTSRSNINLSGNTSKYIDLYEVDGNGKVVAFREFKIDPALDIAH